MADFIKEKQTYKIVFVVLVYRNTNDLKEFFESNKLPCSHTIVVISHYDNQTDNDFKRIATSNSADVVIVPNKGYGYGNNKGVEFALQNYEFDYLIISNADIKIRCFETSMIEKLNDGIIAPEIIAANGKRQNPSEPYKPSRLVHYFAYKLYIGDHWNLIWVYYAWCKLKRILFYFAGEWKRTPQIYAAHGSFVVIPKNVLSQLLPLYNERMFLMNEEGHLAKKARLKGVRTYFVKDIIIDHKEDGSMSLEYRNEFPILKQSFIEFYHYWYQNR